MKNILKDQYIDYLAGLKTITSINKGAIQLKVEKTSNLHFDIIDKMPSIIVAMGQGSATYSNPDCKCVEIIDYEDFINQLPKDCVKDIKRADFILYHADGKDFFIINELSQSSNPSNKRNDAKKQLANAVLHLTRCPETNVYIKSFAEQICIFSNKDRLIKIESNPASAFEKIKEYLPDPIPINFQPITKAGFKAFETATFEL